MKNDLYTYYRQILSDFDAPTAFVDVDNFDDNARKLTYLVKNKRFRIATKSIRCLGLLLRLQQLWQNQCAGFMAYHPLEAHFLAQNGIDNIVLGYPTMYAKAIEAILNNSVMASKVTFMADSLVHLELLNTIAVKYNTHARICIDVDMSVLFPGLYFGVRRSPLRDTEEAHIFLKGISNFKAIKIVGLMGYEAQIAGVADNMPHQWLKNNIVRLLKKYSIPVIQKRRKQWKDALELLTGKPLEFVNGGGTGSILSTRQDESVTEITIGSGLFQSTLFDAYVHQQLRPSVGYMLRVVRKPSANIVTCFSGGFVASGAIGIEKQPQIWLPRDARLINQEGTGEVQTPVMINENLNLNDPIFFRHAKAGEMCERFNELVAIYQGRIIEHYPTYRGMGLNFG